MARKATLPVTMVTAKQSESTMMTLMLKIGCEAEIEIFPSAFYSHNYSLKRIGIIHRIHYTRTETGALVYFFKLTIYEMLLVEQFN